MEEVSVAENKDKLDEREDDGDDEVGDRDPEERFEARCVRTCEYIINTGASPERV